MCDAVRQSGFAISRVLSGMARGIDTLAIRYAIENRLPLTRSLPNGINGAAGRAESRTCRIAQKTPMR